MNAATPSEVVDALVQLVRDAQQRALGNLGFTRAGLGLLIQVVQWTPDDGASIAPSVDHCRSWLAARLGATAGEIATLAGMGASAASNESIRDRLPDSWRRRVGM